MVREEDRRVYNAAVIKPQCFAVVFEGMPDEDGIRCDSLIGELNETHETEVRENQ